MIPSVFDVFKLGVGPSSSHTMGPMIAAGRFVEAIRGTSRLDKIERLRVILYASLALTGRGHATDRAVMLGLSGFEPASLDPDEAEAVLSTVAGAGVLRLGRTHPVAFNPERDIVWAGHERLAPHPNALNLCAFDRAGDVVDERTYFSVGGGFVRDADALARNDEAHCAESVPYPFNSAGELLACASKTGLSIAALTLANEQVTRSHDEIIAGLDTISAAMETCIDRGLRQGGRLPGGLEIPRRARRILQILEARAEAALVDPLAAMDFVNLWALAVSEENAAGGRVVTAPTNGAAGIIPAVLRFYRRFHQGDRAGVHVFLLTAGAIGGLYKRNASISGAEVGCQGEVGAACSMAAAGLCAALGGAPAQVENAAEIAMEHNLGLTCDPIGGLVQIPCIERNAIGAIKAIDAARLALLGDGQHAVSLDKAIATMKQTGGDMNAIYKETALGGLAVNLTEC